MNKRLRFVAFCTLIFLVIFYVAVRHGVTLVCGCPDLPGGCIDGCYGEFNSFLWLPVKLVTGIGRVNGGIAMPNMLGMLGVKEWIVQIVYWGFISSIISIIILRIRDKFKFISNYF